jgi:hypothetical protein
MAGGVVVKHKRKASAFVAGELAAGEMGLDTTNSIWYFSIDGVGVRSIAPDLYVTTADVSIPANFAIYFPSEYEVGSGFVTDLADGAILEIG